MKIKSLIFILAFGLGSIGFVACNSAGNQQASSEESANAPNADTTKIDPCDLKFNEKFTDAKDNNKTASIYVENFDRSNACWTKVESYVTKFASEKGKTQHVFLFDCPHHTTKVMAEKPELEGEFRDYCVARYDIKADGTTELVKMPYTKTEKES